MLLISGGITAIKIGQRTKNKKINNKGKIMASFPSSSSFLSSVTREGIFPFGILFGRDLVCFLAEKELLNLHEYAWVEKMLEGVNHPNEISFLDNEWDRLRLFTVRDVARGNFYKIFKQAMEEAEDIPTFIEEVAVPFLKAGLIISESDYKKLVIGALVHYPKFEAFFDSMGWAREEVAQVIKGLPKDNKNKQFIQQAARKSAEEALLLSPQEQRIRFFALGERAPEFSLDLAPPALLSKISKIRFSPASDLSDEDVSFSYSDADSQRSGSADTELVSPVSDSTSTSTSSSNSNSSNSAGAEELALSSVSVSGGERGIELTGNLISRPRGSINNDISVEPINPARLSMAEALMNLNRVRPKTRDFDRALVQILLCVVSYEEKSQVFAALKDKKVTKTVARKAIASLENNDPLRVAALRSIKPREVCDPSKPIFEEALCFGREFFWKKRGLRKCRVGHGEVGKLAELEVTPE